MQTYKVYSGSICIGKVQATTLSVATRKAVKQFKHSGIWLRTI